MWRHRLKSLAALELLTCGRIGQNTAECILSTPREWRDGLLAEITDHDTLIRWLKEYEPELPALPPPRTLDVRGLLEDSLVSAFDGNDHGNENEPDETTDGRANDKRGPRSSGSFVGTDNEMKTNAEPDDRNEDR